MTRTQQRCAHCRRVLRKGWPGEETEWVACVECHDKAVAEKGFSVWALDMSAIANLLGPRKRK